MMAKMLALNVMKFNEGMITVKGRTVVMMPSEILVFIHEQLREKSGVRMADSVLFNAGKYQTETGSSKYFMEKNELKKIFTRLPMTGDPALEMGREVLKFSGWGDNRISNISDNGNRIVLETHKSPIAEEYLATRGKSKKPVCHYLRGLLEGVIESVYKGKYRSKEVSCRATGLSRTCIFDFKKV